MYICKHACICKLPLPIYMTYPVDFLKLSQSIQASKASKQNFIVGRSELRSDFLKALSAFHVSKLTLMARLIDSSGCQSFDTCASTGKQRKDKNLTENIFRVGCLSRKCLHELYFLLFEMNPRLKF